MSKTPGPTPFAGYGTGDREYRRITLALSFADIAPFATLYSTQALLPELATAFDASPGEATLSLSVATIGLGAALLALCTIGGCEWVPSSPRTAR